MTSLEQLKIVEDLAEALYMQGNSKDREEAQNQVLQLQSSAEHWPTCRSILDNSQSSYALLVAANSMESILTKFWTNFQPEQKKEIRNYFLNYLANHTNLDAYVIGALTKTLCRMTKLGWFDNSVSVECREIVTEVKTFMNLSPDHRLVGLKTLQSLVDEMNTPTSGRSLTSHRKTAVSFRDQSLFTAFQTATHCLKEKTALDANGNVSINVSQMDGHSAKVVQMSMQLCVTCLGFDFIGTNPEDSQEDVGTVQVPSAWRPIVHDCATMQLFFDIYATSEVPTSKLSLQGLVQLSSVRRSLFSNEKERTDFLQSLMNGIERIMTMRIGLNNLQNYHEFCRLLGRLKTSYQLSELVKTANFKGWLELAANFTIMSFQSWQHCMNSIHYLLALWGRMVAAMPYLRAKEDPSDTELLRTCVLKVVESYIQTMLESVDIVAASDGAVEDPLDDEGSLKESMDRLPVIVRAHYQSICGGLCVYWEENISLYAQGAAMAISPQVTKQMQVIEARLVWLVTLVAAIINGSSTDVRKDTGATELLMADAKLCSYVFALCRQINERMQQFGTQGRCDERLEVAILTFFRSFKKLHLLDAALSDRLGQGGLSMRGDRDSVVIPLGRGTNSLLSIAYANRGRGNIGAARLQISDDMGAREGAGAGSTSDIIAKMLGEDDEGNGDGSGENEVSDIFDALGKQHAGLNSAAGVMNLIVEKICSNIRNWHDTDTLLGETLEVFVELVSTYSNSKTLLSLESVNFLVHNHVGQHFPFLGYDSDNKHRVTFYGALSRLVFSSSEDLNNCFDSFIAPNLSIMGQLAQLPVEGLSDPEARVALIGALRDLRGITTSTFNRRTYTLLFEALYPGVFVLLKNVAERLYDDPEVITALFKFLQEFVYNKSQRIQFEQSSANGILLFRESSAIICSYGSRILAVPTKKDDYIEKYKGIRLMLNTAICALGGGYVNFGVFALYNDAALQNVLDVSLQLCLQIPLDDVLTYVKLCRAYFGTIEMFFRNHLDVLSGLESNVFLQLVEANLEGLQSSDGAVISACTDTIDHVATYIFLNQNRDKPTLRRVQSHITSDPALLGKLLTTLCNSLLFNTASNQWALTRPIFTLILIAETAFADYQNQLIATQSPENQVKLAAEFARLTEGMQRTVEVTARDRFTQRLTVFRMNVRGFMNV